MIKESCPLVYGMTVIILESDETLIKKSLQPTLSLEFAVSTVTLSHLTTVAKGISTPISYYITLICQILQES